MKIEGVIVPLITPFLNDEVDFESYKNLVDYYINKGVSGILPLGTTGESPTLNEKEYEEIVAKTMEYNNNRVPVYVGLGGNNTKAVINKLKVVEKYKVDGILSVSPYYNRPDQRGIYAHFSNIAQATDLDIILYNIPYRTGRNIENETIYKLAEIKNIVGIKDACGNINQTLSLLLNPPKDFSILTGEDGFYYTTLLHGGHGGIMASANLQTETFIDIYNKIKQNNHKAAFEQWSKVAGLIPLLFEEPNPTPIKYCLNKMGLISSAEVRLPLVEVSNELASKLDKRLISL
ncbi:MAG: 4-hydroxy-tetrahydrodipicolinate synthase [Bacillota bacterium]|nr:4-hydroxy-tetrahydrodipicolinate synthase [Bacillota bacterium]